jgi:hypothetical protein
MIVCCGLLSLNHTSKEDSWQEEASMKGYPIQKVLPMYAEGVLRSLFLSIFHLIKSPNFIARLFACAAILVSAHRSIISPEFWTVFLDLWRRSFYSRHLHLSLSSTLYRGYLPIAAYNADIDAVFFTSTLYSTCGNTLYDLLGK